MNRTQLQAAGRRLFGADWKSPLARAIGYTYRHFLRVLAAADRPVDPTIEMAVIGVEALKAGFVPSWGQAKIEEPPPRIVKVRKKRPRTAEQVRS